MEPELDSRPFIDIGSVLSDSYRLTRSIDRTGMSAIYEAVLERLPDKRVAVKVLIGALATREEARERFRQEALIASRLRHPNIIRIHDYNANEHPHGDPLEVSEYFCNIAKINREMVLEWKELDKI